MTPFLPNLVLDDIASPKSTWVPGTLESWVEEALQATDSVPLWQNSSPSPSPALPSEYNLDKGGHCNYENIDMGSGSGSGTNSGDTCGSSREEAVGELQRSPSIKDIKRRPAPSCHLKKRKRDAEVHNLSERKRRDKINRKLEALQELLPICRKIDKATLLDETIAHVKALQSQLEQMRNSINGIQQLVMHPMAAMQRSIQLATNLAHMSKMTQLGYTGMQLLPSQVCPLQSQSAPFLPPFLLHQIDNNMAHQDTFRSYMGCQHPQISTDVDLLKKMMDDNSQKYFQIASGSDR